jgi:hypothetical protein
VKERTPLRRGFSSMRTTLDIDEDVLAAARERARREAKTIGQVISGLARAALSASAAGTPTTQPQPSHYGIRPFPRRGNAIVTNEQIDKLREDDAY